MSSDRKLKIVLHGYLKDLYPTSLEMSGKTVAEILNGMSRQIKELRPELGQDKHFISVLGFENPEMLLSPIPSDLTELHIVPSMVGGKGGFLQIALGVALIATGVGIGAGTVLIGSLGITGGTIINLGISMLIGGLLSFLSPTPQTDRSGPVKADPEASKYLGAGQNTVRIGTRIPIAYGRVKAYGHYLSFDIDAKDVAVYGTGVPVPPGFTGAVRYVVREE